MAQTTEKFPHGEWQRLYLAAMTEIDKARLAEKLYNAESAIFERLQKLTAKPETEAERVAIDDAIHGLQVLKRETLNFPDWT